jgi:hypothetical protein
MSRNGLVALAAALASLLAGEASAPAAEALPQPSGPVLLEITGRLGNTNAAGTARFDREMLEALGMTKLRTSTAWTAGAAEFEGILARDLLDAVGAEGATVAATALNDFTTSIPIEELRRYPVMLALKMGGDYLKVRDKGPVWIVYPRDQHEELQDSLTDKRWVWQLKQLHIE